MRNAFWWALIAAALAAIGSGFVQATLQTKPPPVAQLRTAPESVPTSQPNVLRELQRQDVGDAFAQDDVVVDRARTPEPQWQTERLKIVVGVCGNSVAAESGFLRLHFPIAFVVDPAAPQARAFAELVRGNGDVLLVQQASAPDAETLATLRRSLGPFDGVASRNAAGMAIALRGTGLLFFDERGDRANAIDFAATRVPLIQRDVTADNRSASGYVSFMLERAAALSRRTGPVVVFVRPLPSTLVALQTFAGSHDVRMIALQ